MTTLSAARLQAGAVSFFGAFDFDQRKEGISPRRLPAWTRQQVPQPMDVVVRMPAGVRMAFVTDSGIICLRVQTTRMVTPPQAPRPVAFDLMVDGRAAGVWSSDLGNTILLNRSDPNDFKMVRGDAYRVEFRDLGRTRKHCELWLPHNAYVEIRALEIDDGAVITPAPSPAAKRWLHYGSSISHCVEAITPTGTWPSVAARRAGLHLTCLGFGGQCHLDQFVARTIRDTPIDVISLKVGINVINADSMRERVFVPTLHGFLDTIREGKPTTPIVLVSPIYCPSAEMRPGPTVPDENGRFVTLPGHEEIRSGCMTLTRVRALIRDLVDGRRRTDANLHYLDGLELFGSGDAGDLPDDLHPNPQGYARMGERFAEQVFSARGICPV